MTITSQDYQTTLAVTATPDAVFAAVTDPKRWWTGELEGTSTNLGDEFTYRYPGFHYTKQRVSELVPNELVAWDIVEADLPRNPDPAEWTGTQVIFEITTAGDQTEVRFTHRGLVSDLACYEACSGGWDFFIQRSLKNLIATGDGPATPPWAA